MKAHLRRVHNNYRLPIRTLSGWVLINLTNHLGGSIRRSLEAGTLFALLCAEVMNEVSYLVLLFFLFASRGRLDIGATQGKKSSTLAPGALRCSGTRLPFIDAWGVGRESFFVKGRRSGRLPLLTFLDTQGVGPESSLAKEGCSGRRLTTNSKRTIWISKVWVGDELLGAKFRRSTIK